MRFRRTGTFHSESLPMYRMRRWVTPHVMPKSMNERWTGASTKAPVAGTFSLPEIERRQ